MTSHLYLFLLFILVPWVGGKLFLQRDKLFSDDIEREKTRD